MCVLPCMSHHSSGGGGGGTKDVYFIPLVLLTCVSLIFMQPYMHHDSGQARGHRDMDASGEK